MLQRLCRPQQVRLPLSCWIGNNRRYASTSVTEPTTTAVEAVKKSVEFDDGYTDWRPIYKLPLIRLVAAINRLKVYQAVATVAVTPLAFGLSQAGHVSGDTLGVCAALGVSGLMTLSLTSWAFKNIIGYIYVNEQQDQLKFAYVDFWGRRKELQVDIEDVLPDWELQRSRRFFIYQPICLRDGNKQRFKLLLRFGIVTDPIIFEGLFGQ